MANKKYKVIVSEQADEMFLNHLRFLANISTSGATQLKKRMSENLQILSKFPYSYPFFNDDMNIIPANRYRRMYVEKYYLVLYQIVDNVVYVDFIVDCRQDYKWLIT